MEFSYRLEKTAFSSQVLLIPKEAPLVSFQIWVRAGSKYERPGITGISHMLEHMMFKGSENYGPQEHARRIQEMGGEFNAFTAHDKTVYFENIAPEYLEEVIKMEADRFLRPRFDPEEFLREREVVMEERKLRTDNSPYGKAEEELFSLVFQAHPYHWPIIGWSSDIENFNRDALVEYFNLRYTPENSFFVLAGKIPENVLELLEKYFGPWEGKRPKDLPLPEEEEQKGPRRSEMEMQVQAPFVFLGYLAPGYCHRDFPLLSIIDRVLTEGESSRLWQELVHEKGLASKAGGGIYPMADYSLFFFYGVSAAGKDIRALEEALTQEVERAFLTEKELYKARNQVLAETVSSLERAYYTGLSAGDGYLNCADPSTFVKHLEAIKRAKIEDIMECWERHLNGRRRNTVLIKGKG